MPPNCRVERTLSKGGMCSARAANKFARASLGLGRRGAAHAGRYTASSVPHVVDQSTSSKSMFASGFVSAA